MVILNYIISVDLNMARIDFSPNACDERAIVVNKSGVDIVSKTNILSCPRNRITSCLASLLKQT